jgi:hypothetical protein
MTDDFTRIIDARLREIDAAWSAKGYNARHHHAYVARFKHGWLAAVGNAHIGHGRSVDRHPTALSALDALAEAVAAAPVNAEADLGVV